MQPAIRIENLGKKYLVEHGSPRGQYRMLRESLVSAFSAPLRRLRGLASPRSEEFWALKDVSFDVQPGEVVGIIGRNGAGKSTLLKILSQITKPTTGRVDINGRVGSLLEVGTGFHPELTGRENVYLNGAILGMSRREIDRRFDEIVAFAEIDRFLDTPVKRYSSGMYVRLAFSVAAHLEPEIFIVDEVLAVGDAAFQKKCLGKMGTVAESGRTVIFVSHQMSAIRTLCSRAILLNRGAVEATGNTEKIVQKYMDWSNCAQRYVAPKSDKPVAIIQAELQPTCGGLELRTIVWIRSDRDREAAVDVRVHDVIGTPIAYGSAGAFSETELVRLRAGLTKIILRHSISLLAVGRYQLSIDVTRPSVEYFDRAENCLAFDCELPATERFGKRIDQAWGKGSWQLPTLAETVESESELTC